MELKVCAVERGQFIAPRYAQAKTNKMQGERFAYAASLSERFICTRCGDN
jgi:hypothetical protein